MSSTIYFYRPTEQYGFLSQWYLSKFVDENNDTYTSMEQYMMASKARLFYDEMIRIAIMNTTSPDTIKKLGRSVKNFNQDRWDQHKNDIVVQGNYYKF